MKPALLAEWRKLSTVRSTYVFSIIGVFVSALAAFFSGHNSSVGTLSDNGFLASNIVTAINFVTLFSALVALLLVTHEYRYNLILHSLLATRRRWQIIIAKALIAIVYTSLFAGVIIVVTIGMTTLGAKVQGVSLGTQDLHLGELLWRILVYTNLYSVVSIILGLLIRSQVGSIVSLLLFPTLGESLITLLLKDNAKYLPFRVLDSILQPQNAAAYGTTPLTTTVTLLIIAGYVLLGGVAAAVCLAKRDATKGA